MVSLHELWVHPMMCEFHEGTEQLDCSWIELNEISTSVGSLPFVFGRSISIAWVLQNIRVSEMLHGMHQHFDNSNTLIDLRGCDVKSSISKSDYSTRLFHAFITCLIPLYYWIQKTFIFLVVWPSSFCYLCAFLCLLNIWWRWLFWLARILCSH